MEALLLPKTHSSSNLQVFPCLELEPNPAQLHSFIPWHRLMLSLLMQLELWERFYLQCAKKNDHCRLSSSPPPPAGLIAADLLPVNGGSRKYQGCAKNQYFWHILNIQVYQILKIFSNIPKSQYWYGIWMWDFLEIPNFFGSIIPYGNHYRQQSPQ